MDNSGSLVKHWKEKLVGYIQVNRPEKANAYNQALLEDFSLIFHQMETDLEVHIVVISGAGNRSFCAGADIHELSDKDYHFALNLKSAKIFATIAASPKVVLCAINGASVGGGFELALSCDLRIASENARFFFPETKRGLIPAAGGTQRLPKLVGIARAKELILGGKTWNAEEALRFGLVSEVVKSEDLMIRAQQWAEEIAQRDPLALQLAKKAIDPDISLGYSLESVTEALLYQLKAIGKK